MDEIRHIINSHKIGERMQLLDQKWQIFGDIDAIIVRDGVDADDVLKLKTLAIQEWLFRFEFVNSIILISRKKLIVFSSKDKLELLSVVKAKLNEVGKDLVLIEKTDKGLEVDMKNLFDAIEKSHLKKFGGLLKEPQQGKFIDAFNEQLSKRNFQEVDIGANIQELLSVKDASDIITMRKAAECNCYLFGKFIQKIEKILDTGKQETHSSISKHMDDSIAGWKKELEKKYGIKSRFFDFNYSPIIQSGSNFDLRPNAENNDELLSHNYILLNLGCKYFELNSNIFRSLLINPSDEERGHYSALLELHKLAINCLRPGTRLSQVYNEVVNLCKEKYPKLVDCLPNNFGFGIGYEFKESLLLINAKNDREIKEGNSFVVITSFKGLPSRKSKEYALHLSDVIIAKSDGKPEILTDAVSKKLEDVGYALDDETAPANGHASSSKGNFESSKRENNQKYETVDVDDDDRVTRRTRSAKRGILLVEEQDKMRKIRDHQKELLDSKNHELEERLRSGNFIFKPSECSKIVLEKLRTYTADSFPKNLPSKQIHVDSKNNAVLLPINGRLIPFHINCLKNVTKHTESRTATIRFNFQTPLSSTGNIIFPSSSTFGTQPIYIKELMFRSLNPENYNGIVKEIREIQKRLKSSSSAPEQKDLEKVVLQNKLKTLNDLKMRPTITGRKTVGSLTAFANGFKFVSKRNEVIEIPLSNIKHAIYQPCGDNMITIIHFVLKTSMVINKKPHSHIQFYSEVGYTSEDLNDPRRKNRGHELDELEEEELERQAKDHYNRLFLDFTSYVQDHWNSDLKFDSPFLDFGFYGSPFFNNVYIMPTAYCLVSLIESPFLVITLDEIELVALERVDNKIKNFDLVAIFKDYTRPVQTISNIPKSNIDLIKQWLE